MKKFYQKFMFACAFSSFAAALLIGPALRAQTITNVTGLGGSATVVKSLNNAGIVVGFSRTAGDAAQHGFTWQNGVTTDLGTLGGSVSLASSVNDAGHVVGESRTTGDAEVHVLLVRDGQAFDLGTLGGTIGSAVAVNSAGQVAGASTLVDDFVSHAFLWSGNGLVDLGTLGGSSSSVAGLNNLGWVTGDAQTVDDAGLHAFVAAGGVMVDLGTLGGFESYAAAVNDAGVVVGDSFTPSWDYHAFRWENGVMVDLGTLGGTYSDAVAVEVGGGVVGVSTTAGDAELHAFVWREGVMHDLGTLGGNYSSASAVNGHGQVVGDSLNAAGDVHAFMWENGVMTDLNSLLPANSGWVLESASFVNNNGQVVGVGSWNGQSMWYVLSPGPAAPTNTPPNTPPVARAGDDVTVECDRPVQLDGSASSDADGEPLVYEWRLGTLVLGSSAVLSVTLPQGTHVVTLTVTDPHGASSEDSVTVSVVDRTPPVVLAASVTPNVLRPANRTMVPVEVSLSVTDNCDTNVSSRIVSITSSEPVTGPGDKTLVDWQITGPLTAMLRAENASHSSGRVYTLTVASTDASGNTTRTELRVRVPVGNR